MLEEAKFGERYVIVYPELADFRKIYAQYTKKHLEQDNEIVVLLPYYETIDKVITNLQKHDIDVANYGRQGYLLVMDSYKTYTGFQEDRELLFKRLLSHAAMSAKKGISFFMDMGVFSFIDEMEKLATSYRDLIPTEQTFQIKGFFSYHQKDYAKLSSQQKAIRFSNNYKSLIVSS